MRYCLIFLFCSIWWWTYFKNFKIGVYRFLHSNSSYTWVINTNYTQTFKSGGNGKMSEQQIPTSRMYQNLTKYCKSGNICGALIFANFAQNSASTNSKTRENICDILYAHFGHVVVVYWPCVLMQMGNILENVWGLLCFCAAQLLVNVSLYDVKYFCNTKIPSEYLLSTN